MATTIQKDLRYQHEEAGLAPTAHLQTRASLLRRIDDVHKLGLERCAADEKAINILLLAQLDAVGSLHRT